MFKLQAYLAQRTIICASSDCLSINVILICCVCICLQLQKSMVDHNVGRCSLAVSRTSSSNGIGQLVSVVTSVKDAESFGPVLLA